MKAHTDDWVAMEDEDDEGEEEDGEEVISKSKCLCYSSQPYPMYSCIPNANIVSFE